LLRKKVISIGNIIQELKTKNNNHHSFDDEEYERKKKKEDEEVKKNYVELETFSEFQRNCIKELGNVNKKTEDNKHEIDNIYEVLKEKPTLKDLKNLEDYLLNKQDELKIASSRKFADKIDTFKNAKYLETQVSIIYYHYFR